MKNWIVIAWLIIFFPVGLYLMFKHTNWSRKVKTVVAVIFSLFAVLLIASGAVLDFIFVQSFFSIFIGFIMLIYSLITKRNKRYGAIVLVLSILLTGCLAPDIEADHADQEAIEQEEQRLKEEEEEKEREAEAERLRGEAIAAIEAVEEEPTQKNYDKAVKQLENMLDADQELEKRLEEAKADVEEYEEQLTQAKEALKEAEEDKDRASYDEAYELIHSLAVSNPLLEKKLTRLDEELTEIEEEEQRIAEEEAERKAKEEAEQKAKEKAEQKAKEKEEAEKERIAAEQKQAEEAEKKAAQEAQEKKANESRSSGNSGGSSNSQSNGNSGGSSNSQSNGNSNSSNDSQPSEAPAPKPVPGEYVDENGNGLIKGSSGGIYHVPGSTYYKRTTNPVRMFKTVGEAEAAGFRAPKR